jgi:uridine phosphorylase
MEDIIIHPKRGKREQEVPSSGLMLVTPSELQFGRKRLIESGGREQFIFSSSLAIAPDDRFFVAGPAIGAPVAAMTMEKLIVLGAREIIMFGWCGAIDPELRVGDIVVGGVPVSGEGTSRYYPTGSAPLPSAELSSALSQALGEQAIGYSIRNVWTTDAPYREDRKYISGLHDNADVCCVDMEYSALCAVAAFRGISFAALFLVSDELYQERWVPGYVRPDFREKSKQLVSLLLSGSVFGGK